MSLSSVYPPTEYKCCTCGQYKYHEGFGYDNNNELICKECFDAKEQSDEG